MLKQWRLFILLCLSHFLVLNALTTTIAGIGSHNFTVPSWVTSLTVTLYGASGGNGVETSGSSSLGGLGGMISGNLAVVPGELLWVFVGGQGTAGTNTGGWNGGGAACLPSSGTYYASGGGATDIRRYPYELADRLAVAGGGGGSYSGGAGGDGGYPSGGAGVPLENSIYFAGGGGSTTGGTAGAGPGQVGTLGQGGGCNPAWTYGVAGGGGGYYGGGSAQGAGGGGGSSVFPSGYLSSGSAARGNGWAQLDYANSPAPSPNPSAAPTVFPSRSPTTPTSQPSSQPSSQPVSRPSSQPTAQPSRRPSSQPSCNPTSQPTKKPSTPPSSQPSSKPSGQPSGQPSRTPTAQPVGVPSAQPSGQPIAAPTAQPSSQPSVQPSVQPTCSPSRQPTAHPSSQPSDQPTEQPSSKPLSQPSSRPTCQPSQQPSSRPSHRPSVQPTAVPSTQPSNQPSAQPSSTPSAQPSLLPTSQLTTWPSAQPTSQPSCSPSSQPWCVPTTQPSARPTTQPVSVPTGQPSSQPSVQPSIQPSTSPSAPPSTQPSSRPSRQPSGQPSLQPTSQPVATPSAQPSGQPFAAPSGQPSAALTLQAAARQWSLLLGNTTQLSLLASIGDNMWACGQSVGGAVGCVVADTRTASTTEVEFDIDAITSIGYVSSPPSVLLSGTLATANGAVSVIVYCTLGTSLLCTSKQMQVGVVVDGTYNELYTRALFVANYGSNAAVFITDTAFTAPMVYTYLPSSTVTLTLSRAYSIPNFVGSFVAGSSRDSAKVVMGAATQYIFVGWVRVDSGALNGVNVYPESGVLSSIYLVTALVAEPAKPDSFVTGGMAWSGDTGGARAYLLRANALFHTVTYCVRYLPTSSSGGRRSPRGSFSTTSVARGLALTNTLLYMIVDHTVATVDTNTTSLSVLKINAFNGALIAQSSVAAVNGSLFCTDVVANVTTITIVCSIQYNTLSSESVLLAVDTNLTFRRLSAGLKQTTDNLYYAAPFAVATTDIALTTRSAAMDTISVTARPSVAPTVRPSPLPSSIPSAQPSSSPTAAPSVSARPTSQPSSATPTVTHRPSFRPSCAPSRAPRATPTARPTDAPSVDPSAQPTLQPSVTHTAAPSIPRSVAPSRTSRPTAAPTLRPSVLQIGGTGGGSAEDNSDSGESKIPPYTTALVVGGCIVCAIAGAFLMHRRNKHKQKSKTDEPSPSPTLPQSTAGTAAALEADHFSMGEDRDSDSVVVSSMRSSDWGSEYESESEWDGEDESDWEDEDSEYDEASEYGSASEHDDPGESSSDSRNIAIGDNGDSGESDSIRSAETV